MLMVTFGMKKKRDWRGGPLMSDAINEPGPLKVNESGLLKGKTQTQDIIPAEERIWEEGKGREGRGARDSVSVFPCRSENIRELYQ